jgi:hypothetical protein
MREYTDASTRTMDLIINHTCARIETAYGKGAVKMPSPATAYRILSRLQQVQPLFSKSTKRVRDIAVDLHDRTVLCFLRGRVSIC